ncbi:hypothetical protein HBI56_101250 [Parastagonospora nodorum]|nr:hypothetical protein HBH51_201220 [Parastagonospora nodorum]KAH4005815.1 hypothetical protein HBI10_022820 [Parastagonospora nodorum]KAH4011963.1 hypothetical protein HBI13_193180 [Parastagonospora nodorum]KAH4038895.1 hypothetical protein HBI09_041240 [Parastagonospora nodorum]KAH4066528.1 hypothetical protein HBH50_150300 [Parastagonospora nodorum]
MTMIQHAALTLYNSLNSLFLYRTNITTFSLGPPSAVGRLWFHQLVKSEVRYMARVRILLQTQVSSGCYTPGKEVVRVGLSIN